MRASNGEIHLYYSDAAHFVMGGLEGRLWSKERIFMPTSSGRQRHNVLGAISPLSEEFFQVNNDAYINSDSVCELLRQIKKRIKRTANRYRLCWIMRVIRVAKK
ncbi:MAG: hypothetical protein LBT05_14040 [Planctomycetaceae bacterium]|nr:hypothetical protein [Planctomycetaceae bacterium]